MDLNVRDKTAEDTAAGAGFAVLVIVGAAIALLILPGALVVFAAVETLGLRLDRAQAWTFATVVSAATITALRAIGSDWSSALHRYAVASLAITAVALVCRFGLHASWPERIVGMFLHD
ncbi:MAG: hypothetical protein ACHREM_11425 [Polyangiales bacterium]